jgi:hypothetical protein
MERTVKTFLIIAAAVVAGIYFWTHGAPLSPGCRALAAAASGQRADTNFVRLSGEHPDVKLAREHFAMLCGWEHSWWGWRFELSTMFEGEAPAPNGSGLGRKGGS